MTSTSPSEQYRSTEATVPAMWEKDCARQRLGIAIESIATGRASLSMLVTDDMSNGQGNCHGGFVFTLADCAFGLACNTYAEPAVGQHCSITYLMPGAIGDRLTAQATEVSRRGRSGIYDIRVINQKQEHVAEFRGHCRFLAAPAKPTKTASSPESVHPDG